mgnify:FL=1
MSLRVSAIIFQLFKVNIPEKCALTIVELNWNQRLGRDKIEHLSCICSRRPHNSKKRSFHVIERTKTSSKCQKMKNARAKILSYILSNMQICGVFEYQIWKPQFLSVVQFPFDNCHSSFSPTTFFEIGVYEWMVKTPRGS